MKLREGHRLGHYVVLSPLGAGGMGEVYRARDTRLDREVAVKVLAEDFSDDAERVARFEREAKLLASLNHPNVATLFGFEKEGDTHFLAMELVEGETLAERIARGPVPVDEVLPIFLQLADGLEAAHDRGIVHRDLKPANVKLRPDGAVKILDFGLARSSLQDDWAASTPDAPTATAPPTSPGTVLGTSFYMSPEQARGKPLDKRTDLWALGCLLFECLSGNRAFEGTSAPDVLARIASHEPELEALPRDTPPFLRRLLARCLDKDSRRRLRDAGEMRVAIEEYQARSEPGAATSEGEAHGPSRRSLGALLPWGLAALLAGALAYSLTLGRNPESPAREPSKWSVSLAPGSRVATALQSGGRYRYSRLVTLSADGSRLAFSVRYEDGTAELFVRDTDRYVARPVSGTEDARGAFFSPDGKWLAFLAQGQLLKVALAGGSPQRLCEIRETASFDGSWAPDGETIVFATDTGLWRVPAVGGEAQRLTVPQAENGESGHRFPRFTRDGASVLFTIASTPHSNLALLTLASESWEVVLEDASQGVWLPDGQLLFARSGELLVAPTGAGGEVVGSAVTVLEKVQTSAGLAGAVVTHFDVSAEGTLAYVPSSGVVAEDRLLWVDRAGEQTEIATGVGTWVHPRLSPDGRRVSVDIHSPDGMRDIYLYELERGQLNRLTHQGITWESEWSPQGTQLAIMSGHQVGYWSLFLARADFSGSPRQIYQGEHPIPGGWAPDGGELLFSELGQSGVWRLAVDSSSGREGAAEVVLATEMGERFARWSPDGRAIAYVADESGRREVFVRSYPDLGSRLRVSTGGGGEPIWSRDGRELFFRQDDEMLVATVTKLPSLSVGRPRVLFSGASAYDSAAIGHQHYDVSLDGERFLMVEHGKTSGPSEVRVALNWTEELSSTLRGGEAESSP